MGDGTKENPFTREDVLRLIKENGDTAKGLDLSGKVFEEGIDLNSLDLRRIILKEAYLRQAQFKKTLLWQVHLEKADLQHSHLEEAELTEAHLEETNLTGAHLEGADLTGAYLEGADLSITHLEETDFGNAHLEGAFLWGAKFSSDTKLESVEWGNYILGEERVLGDTEGEEKEEYLGMWAVDNPYRRLKLWYTEHGIYNVAGEFFFREMTAQRKSINWWPQPWHRTWSAFHSFVSGYGERPLRVVRWGALVLFGSALLYFFLRGVAPYNLSLQAFLGSLYYSAVSFTALGYGPWFTSASVRSWVQGAGAAEAFIGVFTIALFLVTFTRKMRR